MSDLGKFEIGEVVMLPSTAYGTVESVNGKWVTVWNMEVGRREVYGVTTLLECGDDTGEIDDDELSESYKGTTTFSDWRVEGEI